MNKKIASADLNKMQCDGRSSDFVPKIHIVGNASVVLTKTTAYLSVSKRIGYTPTEEYMIDILNATRQFPVAVNMSLESKRAGNSDYYFEIDRITFDSFLGEGEGVKILQLETIP